MEWKERKSAYHRVLPSFWEGLGGTHKSVKIGKYTFSNRTFFNINSVPEIYLQWEFKFKVHSSIKNSFSSNKIPNVLLAGRLNISKRLGKNWPGKIAIQRDVNKGVKNVEKGINK